MPNPPIRYLHSFRPDNLLEVLSQQLESRDDQLQVQDYLRQIIKTGPYPLPNVTQLLILLLQLDEGLYLLHEFGKSGLSVKLGEQSYISQFLAQQRRHPLLLDVLYRQVRAP